jgi:hypothetical protein
MHSACVPALTPTRRGNLRAESNGNGRRRYPEAENSHRRHGMALKPSSKIFTHLWYARETEEAASFYASVFPDSRVDRVTPLLSDTPSGPPGSVKVPWEQIPGKERAVNRWVGNHRCLCRETDTNRGNDEGDGR